MKYRPATARRARRGEVREAQAPVPRLVTTSLRLRRDIRQYLEELAGRERRSVSDVAERLLEEAIRLRECPGIYFADESAGRVAKVMGTGLGVWEIIRDYLDVGESEERLREIFPQLNPHQIAAARNYYLRFREEISQKLAHHAALTPEVLAARYPGLIRILAVDV